MGDLSGKIEEVYSGNRIIIETININIVIKVIFNLLLVLG